MVNKNLDTNIMMSESAAWSYLDGNYNALLTSSGNNAQLDYFFNQTNGGDYTSIYHNNQTALSAADLKTPVCVFQNGCVEVGHIPHGGRVQLFDMFGRLVVQWLSRKRSAELSICVRSRNYKGDKK